MPPKKRLCVKLTAKLDVEIQKFKKLQVMFLGKKKTEKIEPIDLNKD